jgi:hypothetical protein
VRDGRRSPHSQRSRLRVALVAESPAHATVGAKRYQCGNAQSAGSTSSGSVRCPRRGTPRGTNRVAARGSAALPTAAGRCWCSQPPACGARQPLRPRPFVAVARASMHRPDAEAALGAFDCRERQDDVGSSGVAAPQGRCGARSPPPPHRTRLTRLGSHRAGATPNDTRQLTLLCPKTLSSGGRTTFSAVHDQKPRGSHRLSCASATCNSLRRQATGPQQRKGESSPNPRSCVRLTQVFRSLQARKVLKASSSCA